jgi:hypothetical protein
MIGTHTVQKREALATPGRPGLHKIAKQFGVRTGTVQRIGSPRDVVLAWDLRRGCVE